MDAVAPSTAPIRLWAHMRRLWPRYTLLPAAPFVLWSLYCLLVRREPRWELVLVILFVPFIAYFNRRTVRLYWGILPFGLVGLLYDGMRFVKNWGLSESTVHLCDLRTAEMRWFGVTSGGVRMTLQDWFQAHPSKVLDALCAIPYGTYLFIPLGYATYLYFRDYVGTQRYMCAFLALNVLGFLTYHLYPAAPPWYFHTHGCAVDLASRAYEGAPLARVDAAIGIKWFAGLYGRSSDTFGAVPSLHVAYPFLMLLEGWNKHRRFGRGLIFAFFASTCFAAVYLDHHWVIDLLVGLLYTVAIYFPIRRLFAGRVGGHVQAMELASG